jgi:predicted nucleotidyltransferase
MSIPCRDDLARIVREELTRFRPVVVYLYGSVAKGTPRPESDLDVAFLPSFACDAYDVFRAEQVLAAKLGRDVDLADLSRAGAVLKAQVLEHGERLLVCDAERAAEFEMLALSDYARLNEERREVLALFGR